MIDPATAFIAQIESVRTRLSTQEVLITLSVPVEHAGILSGFLSRVGQSVGVAFGEMDAKNRSAAQPRKVSVGGLLAEYLHRRGYFFGLPLWQALDRANIYTADDHKFWVQSQACFFADGVGARMGAGVPCHGDVVAHHVTGAALPVGGRDSEHPRKPMHWFTLPACFAHHTWVHGRECSRADKALLTQHAVLRTAEQAKAALKMILKIDSLTELTPEILNAWERAVGLPITHYEPGKEVAE